MDSNESTVKPMSTLGRITGIFTSPRETFEGIEQKPTWLVPFLIVVIITMITQYFVLDINLNDRIATMEAQGLPAEQISQQETALNSPLKYIGLVFIPIATPIVWALIAGLILLAANLLLSGKSDFKKIFAMVAWTGLIGVISVIILSFLIYSKGTANGVAMDLSVLLETPPLGESKSILYRIAQRFDLFIFWEMALWTIGLSVFYKTTVQKALTPIAILWVIWVIIAVGLGSVFSKFIPGF